MSEFLAVVGWFVLPAFGLSVLLTWAEIPVLRRLKFGQEIREIGPSWHGKKSGTPTMGGISFILAAVAVAGFWLWVFCEAFGGSYDAVTASEIQRFWSIILLSLAFGVIGFVDDFIKVILKRNLGLTSGKKFLLQLVVATAFVVAALKMGIVDTGIWVPFLKTPFDLGMFYVPLMVVVIVGAVNAVNLTDGLDGLATSVTIVVLAFFAVLMTVVGGSDLFMFVLALIGALLGFLLFNKNPAKVFMGDTGSLFLGGAVVGIAMLMKLPLMLLIVGFVYAAEALSVIIQVAAFKLTGKRVFKMSPLHHHFELTGWSEKRIVAVFTGVTVVLCAVGYLMINN